MYSPVPSVVAILVALLLIVPLVAFAVWYFRLRRKSTMPGGILSDVDGNAAASAGVNQSYENPYFNQEITMSHLQVSLKKAASIFVVFKVAGIHKRLCHELKKFLSPLDQDMQKRDNLPL